MIKTLKERDASEEEESTKRRINLEELFPKLNLSFNKSQLEFY